MAEWNIIILIIQLIIMIVEIWVAFTASKSALCSDRGFFMVNTKNRGEAPWQSWKIFDFDSIDGRNVTFVLKNAVTVLRSAKYSVNGIQRSMDKVNNTLFSLDDCSGYLTVPLSLKDEDISSGFIYIDFVFRLESLAGIKYVERIRLSFSKAKDNGNYWELREYSPRIDK